MTIAVTSNLKSRTTFESQNSDSIVKSDVIKDTDECVMTSHTEMCEQSVKECEVTSVEEGHDVEFENYAKDSQETKKGRKSCRTRKRPCLGV